MSGSKACSIKDFDRVLHANFYNTLKRNVNVYSLFETIQEEFSEVATQ